MRRARKSGSRRRKFRWGDSWWFQNVPITVDAHSSQIQTAWLKLPAGIHRHTVTVDTDIIGGGDEPTDETLTRNLINFTMALDPSPYAVHVQAGTYGAMGIIAWDGIDDTAPDALSVPWPISDEEDADWIWKHVQPFSNISPPDATLGMGQVAPIVELHCVSKAQRKLSAKTGLLLVVQVRNEDDDNVDFVWTWYNRMLFRMP